MDGLNQYESKPNSKRADVSKAATDLLDEGKTYANELYEDGLKKVEEAKKEAADLADDLLEKVRAHPLKAVLIAGGIGLLLSALLRK